MSKSALIVIAGVLLVAFNVAAFKYTGFFGLFIAAASYDLAEKLIDMIGAIDGKKDGDNPNEQGGSP